MFTAVCVAFLAGTGCMMSPTHYGEPIESIHAPLHFTGYTIAADREITLECKSASLLDYDDPWIAFHTVTSTNTPITYQGQSLYPYSADVVVPAPCWEGPIAQDSTLHTKVRSVDDLTGTPHYSYNDEGIECLFTTVQGGGLFYDAGESCALKLSGDAKGTAIVRAHP